MMTANGYKAGAKTVNKSVQQSVWSEMDKTHDTCYRLHKFTSSECEIYVDICLNAWIIIWTNLSKQQPTWRYIS